jgi:peptide/nickel transport system permease protein
MLNYIIRRVLYVIPIGLGVTVLVFALVHMSPGDPLSAVVPPDAPEEMVQDLRKAYGFDKPLPVQYVTWLGRVLVGDLGVSVARGREVVEELRIAVPNTFILAAGGTLLGFTLGAILGGIAGFFQGRWIDKLATSIAITGVSVPHYWLGLVLVIVFSVEMNVLPSIGMGPGGSTAWEWDAEHMRHLVLPVITLAVIPMGLITRTVRATVAEILNQEFVQALHAKGLFQRQVLLHIVRNAAPTTLAVMGLQLGYLLGGVLFVEVIFAWPGIGYQLWQAIQARDIPTIQGASLIIAVAFVLVNLAVDVFNAYTDPKIRISEGVRSR